MVLNGLSNPAGEETGLFGSSRPRCGQWEELSGVRSGGCDGRGHHAGEHCSNHCSSERRRHVSCPSDAIFV